MDASDAAEIARHAVMLGLLISSPLLVVGLVVGLGMGLIQALTQVQEQTVAFVPKLIAMSLALSIALPWLIGQMTEYVRELFESIPGSL